jgi:6-phosphogluconolactonase
MHQRRSVRRLLTIAVAAALLLAAVPVGAQACPPPSAPKAVYAMTNEVTNAIAVFTRSSGGQLTSAGSVPTGGQGTGVALGSQGALVESADGRWLFTVNAGSNDISVFKVTSTGLTLTDVHSAEGTRPVSLTLHRNLLYVLDVGGSGHIAGFAVSTLGKLTTIPNSIRPLSNNFIGASPDAPCIGFKPNGTRLVVTEKNTNFIDTYEIGRFGRASLPTIHLSSGPVPFGFDFSRVNKLIVSEAAASAASSYNVFDRHFSPITKSLVNGQAAACWLIVSKDQRFAFTGNAGSGTLSSYKIDALGRLTLLAGVAATTGAHPVDMAQSSDGKFLYSLANGDGTIHEFRLMRNGTLVPLGSVSGLPLSSTGLAAR